MKAVTISFLKILANVRRLGDLGGPGGVEIGVCAVDACGSQRTAWFLLSSVGF